MVFHDPVLLSFSKSHHVLDLLQQTEKDKLSYNKIIEEISL